MISLALYQPDIPQNTGTILRLGACLGVAVHVIEPAGFGLSDRSLRRAGMDYLAHSRLVRHRSWDDFEAPRRETAARLVLLTTRAALPYTDFVFSTEDIILLGRESAGVPDAVHEAADARLLIPMVAGLRSVNVATAAAMVLGEALRQTNRFPRLRSGGRPQAMMRNPA
ncbi:MAG: tRNA (cytidine(34)-2'-O)-methyltransferase [Bauldia sp.]|nr:tRNA (cytidine(34)-2'-O)-methyltransferase [Bauldia sp.]